MVKCPVCGEEFSKKNEEFEHVGNRYYHLSCYKKKMKEEEYKEKIHEYCKKIYGDMYVKSRIEKQIKELLNDGTGKTISGIYRSLVWHYEKNNGDVEKSHGSIRIVDYVYKDAEEYYMKQYELQKRNAEIMNNMSQNTEKEIFHIRPQAIKKPKRINLFELK